MNTKFADSIKDLAEDRRMAQKKTFTKWVNSHLQQAKLHVSDLFVDLQDGSKLIRLFELLSGKSLPKVNRGQLRVHKLENMCNIIKFLRNEKIHLENTGPNDLVDGNPNITLGLIWKSILFYQIQNISESDQNGSKLSATNALLIWCKNMLSGYDGVIVKDFTDSWKNGLAFCGIIHKHRPDLINYQNLKPDEASKNLALAFQVADRHLGINPLIDVTDMVNPDEKSIITYISSIYHYFSKVKQNQIGEFRIQEIIKCTKENIDKSKLQELELLALKEWIISATNNLNKMTETNSISGVQNLMQEFSNYLCKTKPEKFTLKTKIDSDVSCLTSKYELNHQKLSLKNTALVEEINKLWDLLEKSEFEKENQIKALIERHKLLDQMVERFNKKAIHRLQWIKETTSLLKSDIREEELCALEAAKRKHEIMEADIKNYENRLNSLYALCDEIEATGYFDMIGIKFKKFEVIELWSKLQEVLSEKSSSISQRIDKIISRQDLTQLIEWTVTTLSRVKNNELSVGGDLVQLEVLLHKHRLIITEIASHELKIKTIIECEENACIEVNGEWIVIDVDPISKQNLTEAYNELKDLVEVRKTYLEEEVLFERFIRDAIADNQWLNEMEKNLSTEHKFDIDNYIALNTTLKYDGVIKDKDSRLNTLINLTIINSNLEILQKDIKNRKKLWESFSSNYQCSNEDHAKVSKDWISKLNERWKKLIKLLNDRSKESESIKTYVDFFSKVRIISDSLNEYKILIKKEISNDEFLITDQLNKLKALKNSIDIIQNEINYLIIESKKMTNITNTSNSKINSLIDSLQKEYAAINSLYQSKCDLINNNFAVISLISEMELLRSWIIEKNNTLTTYYNLDCKEYSLHIYDRSLSIQAHFENFKKAFDLQKQSYISIKEKSKMLNSTAASQEHQLEKHYKELKSAWKMLKNNTKYKSQYLFESCKMLSLCRQIDLLINEISGKLESFQKIKCQSSDSLIISRNLALSKKRMIVINKQISEMCEVSENFIYDTKHVDTTLVKQMMKSLSSLVQSYSNKIEEIELEINSISSIQQWTSILKEIISWCENIKHDLSEVDDSNIDYLSLIEQRTSLLSELNVELRYRNDELERINKMLSFSSVNVNATEKKLLTDAQKLVTEVNEDIIRRSTILATLSHYLNFVKECSLVENLLNAEDYEMNRNVNIDNLEVAQRQLERWTQLSNKMKIRDQKIDELTNKCDNVAVIKNFMKSRNYNLLEKIMNRAKINSKNALEESERIKQYYLFLRFCDVCKEVENWLIPINEKISTLENSNLKNTDILNSLSLMRNEISTLEARYSDCKEMSESIISSDGLYKKSTHDRYIKIQKLWNDISERLRNYFTKIESEINMERFDSFALSVKSWCDATNDEVNLLANASNSFTSSSEALVKFDAIRLELQARSENFRAICDSVGNKLSANQIESQKTLELNFNNLNTLLNDKMGTLKICIDVIQFRHDVECELAWITKQTDYFISKSFGKSRIETQRLKVTAMALKQEIQSFKSITVNNLLNTGKDLVVLLEKAFAIAENHTSSPASSTCTKVQVMNNSFDVDQIKELINFLTTSWKDLPILLNSYMLSLDLTLQLFEYQFHANEAELWLHKMHATATSTEYGHDEISASRMLSLEKAFNDDIKAFNIKYIEKIIENANQLKNNNHPNINIIIERQKFLVNYVSNVLECNASRIQCLDGNVKFFQIKREFDELVIWIRNQLNILVQDQYGHNLKECQAHIESFRAIAEDSVVLGSQRVTLVHTLIDVLISTSHPKSEEFFKWKLEIDSKWNSLQNSIQMKRQILEHAREVHLWDEIYEEVVIVIKHKSQELEMLIKKKSNESPGTQLLHQLEFNSSLEPMESSCKSLLQKAKCIIERIGLSSFNDISDVKECDDLFICYQNRLSAALIGFYKYHKSIEERSKLLEKEWNELDTNAKNRANYLKDSIEYKKLLDGMKELSNDCSLLLKQILSDEVPSDLMSCHMLMMTHQDRKIEIDRSQKSFDNLKSRSNQMIASDHFAKTEIENQLKTMIENFEKLNTLWNKNMEIITLELDAFEYLHDSHEINSMIIHNIENMNNVKMPVDQSSANINYLHEKINRAIVCQKKRIPNVERITLLEKYFNVPVHIDHIQIRKNDLNDISFVDGSKDKEVTYKRTYCSVVSRKSIMDSWNHNSTNRAWKPCSAGLYGYMLCFFKQSSDPVKTQKPLIVTNVTGAEIKVANDYVKKKFVFKITQPSGAVTLIQCEKQIEMDGWIMHLTVAAGLCQVLINKSKFQSSLKSSHKTNNNDADNLQMINTSKNDISEIEVADNMKQKSSVDSEIDVKKKGGIFNLMLGLKDKPKSSYQNDVFVSKDDKSSKEMISEKDISKNYKKDTESKKQDKIKEKEKKKVDEKDREKVKDNEKDKKKEKDKVVEKDKNKDKKNVDEKDFEKEKRKNTDSKMDKEKMEEIDTEKGLENGNDNVKNEDEKNEKSYEDDNEKEKQKNTDKEMDKEKIKDKEKNYDKQKKKEIVEEKDNEKEKHKNKDKKTDKEKIDETDNEKVKEKKKKQIKEKDKFLKKKDKYKFSEENIKKDEINSSVNNAATTLEYSKSFNGNNNPVNNSVNRTDPVNNSVDNDTKFNSLIRSHDSISKSFPVVDDSKESSAIMLIDNQNNNKADNEVNAKSPCLVNEVKESFTNCTKSDKTVSSEVCSNVVPLKPISNVHTEVEVSEEAPVKRKSSFSLFRMKKK